MKRLDNLSSQINPWTLDQDNKASILKTHQPSQSHLKSDQFNIKPTSSMLKSITFCDSHFTEQVCDLVKHSENGSSKDDGLNLCPGLLNDFDEAPIQEPLLQTAPPPAYRSILNLIWCRQQSIHHAHQLCSRQLNDRYQFGLLNPQQKKTLNLAFASPYQQQVQQGIQPQPLHKHDDLQYLILLLLPHNLITNNHKFNNFLKKKLISNHYWSTYLSTSKAEINRLFEGDDSESGLFKSTSTNKLKLMHLAYLQYNNCKLDQI
ncbi:unnamed protein product [Paramecium octaurelia]|uniref:Uncharacterized protein n=1 Tax=Paramecium octaurelia TaxID=43137 RepID=A0A8S1VZT5_PAROT|nr:unnamed protein product [Paramecium octaurelia]